MSNKIIKSAFAAALFVAGTISTLTFHSDADAANSIKNNISLKGWNTEVTETEAVSSAAIKYHIYSSDDKKEAWIYNIEIDRNANETNLDIPDTINGKTVTRLGWLGKSNYCAEDREDCYDEEGNGKNIFGQSINQRYGSWVINGYYGPSETGIKNVTIPNTVNVLMESTFADMNYLENVNIPDGIEVIPDELFCGCNNLRSIKLPKNMKSFRPSALTECHKLNRITIPAGCKKYAVKGKCIVNKKNKSLEFCFASGKKYSIPKGIKKLNSTSFTNCTAETIHIPESVKVIDGTAFQLSSGLSSNNIKNVTVSSKNKVYARDGQTIYNKKDNSLAVAIVKGTKENSKYVMSNKVKVLKDSGHSVVNLDEENASIENLYVSKNLKKAGAYGWGVVQQAKNVYFKSKTVPKVSKYDENRANLPIFTHIHVPKAANKQYKKLYRDNKMMMYVDEWSISR